jgi:hypothetical protein
LGYGIVKTSFGFGGLEVQILVSHIPHHRPIVKTVSLRYNPGVVIRLSWLESSRARFP